MSKVVSAEVMDRVSRGKWRPGGPDWRAAEPAPVIVAKVEKAISRQVQWQQANRKRYNARMREVMKARRDAVKAARGELKQKGT